MTIWKKIIPDRLRDLNHLILETQGNLLIFTRCKSSKKYNERLREIINKIQDLRDELPNL